MKKLTRNYLRQYKEVMNMIGQVIKSLIKNKKVILTIVVGGVAIVVSFVAVFNIDRTIKNMKLNYADTISEYKNVLWDVENKLANEALTSLEKKQLEKIKLHCIKKQMNLIKSSRRD